MQVMAAEIVVGGGEKVLVKVKMEDVSGEQVGDMQGFSDVCKGKGVMVVRGKGNR